MLGCPCGCHKDATAISKSSKMPLGCRIEFPPPPVPFQVPKHLWEWRDVTLSALSEAWGEGGDRGCSACHTALRAFKISLWQPQGPPHV